MKAFTTILFAFLFVTVSQAQNFGCFSTPSSGNGDGVFDCARRSTSTNSSIYYDSLLWAKYDVPFTDDGYYKSMWNKYQVKMEGNVINDMRQGLWKLYLPGENAFYELNYIDNKKNGVCNRYEIFKKDTFLRMQWSYKNDLRDGMFITYRFDTVVSSIVNYKDGNLNGVYKNYSFYSKKHLSSIYNYTNDKRNGIQKLYKLDDKDKVYLYRISNYNNGKQLGKEYELSNTGDTISIYDYSSNEPLGVLEYSENIYNGKYLVSYREKNGIEEDYDFTNNGDTTSIKIYDKIKGEGVTKYFALDSIKNTWKVDRVTEYYNNKLDFKYKKYYPNGQLAFEILFKNNLLYTAVAAYSIDGNKLDIGTLKNGNGTLNCYYPDGNLKSTFTYKKSICIGEIFSYFQNGNIHIKAEMHNVPPKDFSFSKYSSEGIDMNLFYLDNNLYGDINVFYLNKSKRSVIVYDTTSLISSFKYYYDNNSISTICSRFENQYTGLYVLYYKNGNMEKEGNYKINSKGYPVEDSIWNFYYEEGYLRASVCYSMGEKVGKSKYYDEIGTLKRVEIIENNGIVYNLFDGDTVNYLDENGLKQGKWIYFSPIYSFSDNDCSDIPNAIEYYKDDNPVGIWKDRFGNRIYAWKDTTIAYVYIYTQNDILFAEGEMVDVYHRFGVWKEYHREKGYLLEKGEYTYGYRIGIWESYKKNGKLKRKTDYSKK